MCALQGNSFQYFEINHDPSVCSVEVSLFSIRHCLCNLITFRKASSCKKEGGTQVERQDIRLRAIWVMVVNVAAMRQTKRKAHFNTERKKSKSHKKEENKKIIKNSRTKQRCSEHYLGFRMWGHSGVVVPGSTR